MATVAAQTKIDLTVCGSYALMEQCILEGTGRVKAYTCLDLLDKWIEEHNLQ